MLPKLKTIGVTPLARSLGWFSVRVVPKTWYLPLSTKASVTPSPVLPVARMTNTDVLVVLLEAMVEESGGREPVCAHGRLASRKQGLVPCPVSSPSTTEQSRKDSDFFRKSFFHASAPSNKKKNKPQASFAIRSSHRHPVFLGGSVLPRTEPGSPRT